MGINWKYCNIYYISINNSKSLTFVNTNDKYSQEFSRSWRLKNYQRFLENILYFLDRSWSKSKKWDIWDGKPVKFQQC